MVAIKFVSPGVPLKVTPLAKVRSLFPNTVTPLVIKNVPEVKVLEADIVNRFAGEVPVKLIVTLAAVEPKVVGHSEPCVLAVVPL